MVIVRARRLIPALASKSWRCLLRVSPPLIVSTYVFNVQNFHLESLITIISFVTEQHILHLTLLHPPKTQITWLFLCHFLFSLSTLFHSFFLNLRYVCSKVRHQWAYLQHFCQNLPLIFRAKSSLWSVLLAALVLKPHAILYDWALKVSSWPYVSFGKASKPDLLYTLRQTAQLM
jgi:hypothetical protein